MNEGIIVAIADTANTDDRGEMPEQFVADQGTCGLQEEI